MSLRDAVLVALLEGESSGYDLAKMFDGSLANFWLVTSQQLYRELDRLAEEGLIQGRVVQQERRPNKRMFSLTEAGRQAIAQYTTEPPKPAVIREDLLVKVHAVDVGDAAAVCEFLREYRQRSIAKLESYDRLKALILNGRTEQEHFAKAERLGPLLTLQRGFSFEEENIRWAEHALTILSNRLAAPFERVNDDDNGHAEATSGGSNQQHVAANGAGSSAAQ